MSAELISSLDRVPACELVRVSKRSLTGRGILVEKGIAQELYAADVATVTATAAAVKSALLVRLPLPYRPHIVEFTKKCFIESKGGFANLATGGPIRCYYTHSAIQILKQQYEAKVPQASVRTTLAADALIHFGHESWINAIIDAAEATLDEILSTDDGQYTLEDLYHAIAVIQNFADLDGYLADRKDRIIDHLRNCFRVVPDQGYSTFYLSRSGPSHCLSGSFFASRIADQLRSWDDFGSNWRAAASYASKCWNEDSGGFWTTPYTGPREDNNSIISTFFALDIDRRCRRSSLGLTVRGIGRSLELFLRSCRAWGAYKYQPQDKIANVVPTFYVLRCFELLELSSSLLTRILVRGFVSRLNDSVTGGYKAVAASLDNELRATIESVQPAGGEAFINAVHPVPDMDDKRIIEFPMELRNPASMDSDLVDNSYLETQIQSSYRWWFANENRIASQYSEDFKSVGIPLGVADESELIIGDSDEDVRQRARERNLDLILVDRVGTGSFDLCWFRGEDAET